MVKAAVDHIYKTDAPFVKEPKKDIFKEVQEVSADAIKRVRAAILIIYEAARDSGDLWKAGGKGRLLAHCTELYLNEFGDKTKFSHDDLVWICSMIHADITVQQLM
jgi:hypothetical protein